MRKILEQTKQLEELTRMPTMITSQIGLINQVASLCAINDCSIGIWKSIHSTPLMQLNATVESISSVQHMATISKTVSAFSSPVIQWLDSFAYTPLHTFLNSLASHLSVDIDDDAYAEFYREQMYLAKWFPYAGSVINPFFVEDINQVFLHTKEGSQNRSKKIDKVIFSYYTKTKLEDIRKSWKELELPKYLLKILRQAIQAYYRGEYAMTVCSLATLWEGIICDKSNDDTYRKDKKTKNHLKQLVDENGYEDIIYSFCDEFIFYQCSNPNEVKDDVPGRHGIAHCWYNKYPTKKSALNAILFTDFLLNLQPILDIK